MRATLPSARYCFLSRRTDDPTGATRVAHDLQRVGGGRVGDSGPPLRGSDVKHAQVFIRGARDKEGRAEVYRGDPKHQPEIKSPA